MALFAAFIVFAVLRRRSRKRGPRERMERLVTDGERMLSRLQSKANRARGEAGKQLKSRAKRIEKEQEEIRERLIRLRQDAEAALRK
jgi:hypothetical protein